MANIFLKNKKPVISIVSSNSGVGKTTLLESLIEIFSKRGFKVGALKHDAHKFEIDKEGKDTWRMKKSGASRVMIGSKHKFAMISDTREEKTVDELLKYFEEDIIFIEGFKDNRYPKIEVHRKEASKETLFNSGKYREDTFLAIATNSKVEGIKNLDLNKPIEIANFIEEVISKEELKLQTQFILNDNVKKVEVISLSPSGACEKEDLIAVEYPLEVQVFNLDFELKTKYQLFCTPDNLEELVIGSLNTNGIISSTRQIKKLQVDLKENKAIVILNDNEKVTDKKIKTQSKYINPEVIYESMTQNLNGSQIFKDTGGVHSIGYIDSNGLKKSFEDIGRHNALDKLIGYLMKNGINSDSVAVITSGRISHDMVLKCNSYKIPMIIGKSAPTSMAIQIAIENDMTLIGFVRGNRLNIYNQGKRLKVIDETLENIKIDIEKLREEAVLKRREEKERQKVIYRG